MPIPRKEKELLEIYRHENKEIKIVKDRWSDGVVLEISHNGWQTTCINDLDLEDLKKLRRVIRKAIREYENNSNKRW